jgi:hypothetical protein
MPDLLAASAETLVIAQIEDPEAVDAVEEIAATPGIDALFLGPADLTVGYGHDAQDNADVARAYARTGEAARASGRAFMTFVPDAERAKAMHADYGVSVFFIASEHAWMLQGARRDVAGIRELGDAPAACREKVCFSSSCCHRRVRRTRCGSSLPEPGAPAPFPRREAGESDEKNTHSLRPCRACRSGCGRLHAHHGRVAQPRAARDRAGRGCAAAELGFR